MRSRPVRRLHGDCEGARGSLLCDAGVDDGGRGDYDAGGIGHDREAASDPARVHRRAGGPVRILPERRHPHRESLSRSESESDRTADPASDVGRVVPLLHAQPDVRRDQEVRLGEAVMSGALSRRDFLKQSGGLVVSFSLAPLARLEPSRDGLVQRGGGAPRSQIDAKQVDSWIGIGADGRVTAYSGKCELGQGMHTTQVQLIAEELAVPIDRVTLIMCDTSISPDQGTTSGSQSHPANFNHQNLALACATAREALVGLAATRLGVPADQLTVTDGVVAAKNDASKQVSYGELVGGKKFSLALNPNAKRRDPRSWKVLGTSVPRVDLPSLVTGQMEFVQNVRVPGMVHGRVVRPPAVGATLVSVDESSVQGMPGVIKVVVRKNFVGVVAEKPWQAIQAAGTLKATWTPVSLPPERVRVVFTRGSGCYGLNGADTVSYDAALLSQAAGRPVRVQLSRKDEMAFENYGQPYVIEQRVALDRDGNIVAWDHESWSATLGNRPGYDTPGNVITGTLAGFQPAAFAPRTPAPPPSGRFDNGSNAAPSYVAGCVSDACGGTGSVKSERGLTHANRGPC